jgi:hypothetical protein
MFSPSAIHRQSLLKAALIFLFSLLSIALIITWNAPATGFEVSIYRSTPLILWVSLISSVIAGITITVVSITKSELDLSYLWKIGFLLVFLSYVVCLALFIIRGYYMWCMGGDPASHIGWIKETLDTGHAPTSLIYPITHIYLSEIIFMTDLNLVFLHKIMPVIFSILFILYMYVFAKTIFHNTAASLLVGIVSCASFRTDFYLNLIPSGLSSLLLPLVLFVIFKCIYQRCLAWAVPRSILVILYPVFHPVSTLFIGLVLITLWIPHTIPGIGHSNHGGITLSDFENYKFKFMRPFLTLLMWFLFWISSFRIWDITIKKIYQAIFGEGVTSEGMQLLDKIDYAREYGYSITEIVIRQYGASIILFGLSVLAVFLLLKNHRYGRYNNSLLSLSGPFAALSIIIPVLFLFDLSFNAFRFLHALTILMLILSAYTLYTLLIYKRKYSLLKGTTFAVVIAAMILSGLFFGGLLSLYPSPYNFGTSYHNTHSEVVGMKYVYDHRNATIPLTGISIAPGRFAGAFLTPEERTIQCLPLYLRDQNRVPWHFGYDTNSSLSSAYDKETNLIIVPRDRVIYTDIFPDMAKHRFTRQDFQKLEIDPGVDALYSNGEFDFFKVNVFNSPPRNEQDLLN